MLTQFIDACIQHKEEMSEYIWSYDGKSHTKACVAMENITYIENKLRKHIFYIHWNKHHWITLKYNIHCLFKK